jgi:hypothetical protein
MHGSKSSAFIDPNYLGEDDTSSDEEIQFGSIPD